jgi:hypothetical protein
MMNLLMNDTVVWGLIGVGFALLAWIWWPKKKFTEALEEVKAEEAAAPVAAVNDQITDAVTQAAPAKKTRAKKPATPKVASKKAPAKTTKKAAPKKAVKKGRK